MAYTTLQYGSTGEEVKKLQEKLISDGYDLGTSGADGIYGTKTQAAVQKYQKANSLTVDGIAGEQTLSKLYSTNAAVQSSAVQSVQTPVQTNVETPSYRYDSESDEVYQQALQQLQTAKENRPTYAGTYEQQLQEIYDRIMNREDFSFDLNGDPLWQQYKDQYVQQGQMAMMDAMGQAAALTGGYGNTYAQRAGQQAYQQYLQGLTDKIPELHELALNRYNQEGDRLNEQFALTGELAADEYSKYQDAETRYWQDVDRAQSEADTAYDRGQTAWYNELQLKQQADDTAYTKQQDAYDRLVNLITSTGYSPSEEELTAAGMSAAQAAAYAKYYNDQNTSTYAYSYSSDGTTEDAKTTKLSLDSVKEQLTAQGYADAITAGVLKESEWKKSGYASEFSSYEEYLQHCLDTADLEAEYAYLARHGTSYERNSFLGMAIRDGAITAQQRVDWQKKYML